MLDIEILQQIIFSLGLALVLVYITRLPKFSLFFSSLLFILLILGFNFIPIWRGSSLVELARGAIGDVSIASGVLLLLIILNQFDFSEKRLPVLNFGEKLALFLIGLILYLSTFGFIKIDVYSWGYLSTCLSLIIAVAAASLIIFNRRLGIVFLAALAGFYYQAQFSNNLWDYIYDPVLWFVLLLNLINILILARFKRKSHID